MLTENLKDEHGNKLQVLSTTILADNSTILKVYYTRNLYTITFMPNGGKGEEKIQSFKFEQTKNLEINSFTRSGFDFAGWAEGDNVQVSLER